MEPLKLCDNLEQRERMDELAQLYSIIVTTERLEKLFIKGINKDQYMKHIKDLVNKYNTVHKLANLNIHEFSKTYGMNCRYASERFSKGVPKDDKTSMKDFAVATQNFITTMDILKLDMRNMDDIFPQISELCDSLDVVKNITFDGRDKMFNWKLKLSKLEVTYALNDDEVRQLSFDLENAYNGYMKTLGKIQDN